MTTAVPKSPSYQQVPASARRLSLEEQLALVADIASVLREAVHSEDEFKEAAYLAESPAFKRIVDRGLKHVMEGKARRVEELLSEL